MKTCIFVWLLSILSVFSGAQNADEVRKNRTPDLNEHVEVLNVEVIARVQDRGQPVGGLKKEDFILSVNGRKVEINGFREERRRISQPPETAGEAAPGSRPPPSASGRLFILCFWLWDSRSPFSEALDRFFREIYRPGDVALLAHTKDVQMIESPEQVAAVRASFESALKKTLTFDNQARLGSYREIDDAISQYLNRPPNETEEAARNRLQMTIAGIWQSFRSRFLRSDEGALSRLAEALKTVNREKWVLAFIQEEVFPRFPESGEIPAIRNPLDEMRKTLADTASAFNEKIRSAFIAAGATVSLVRIGSSGSETQGQSPYYSQKPVYSDRDECFSQISAVTGGVTVRDGNLARALGTVAEKEDVRYIFSFVPTEKKKKMKIQLECRDGSLKVIAERRSQFADPNQLAIADTRVVNSILRFTLRGYARIFEEGRLQGRVRVEVVAKGPGAGNAENSREFTPADPAVEIPVALRLPRNWLFKFKIRVLDQVTGRELVKETTLRNM